MIKARSRELGFLDIGFSKARFLDEEKESYNSYLEKDYNASMAYLERNVEKRLDPTKLLEGTKTVISLLFNYFPKEKIDENSLYKISKYAYGKDYHKVIKKKLKALFQFIQSEIPDSDGRYFVDSAPVLEKAWAAKSGLGWIGKNGNLINKNYGSFFFISEILLNIDLPTDNAVKDYCGSCTLCIDACPTKAILAPHIIDSNKCISFLTIENKEEIPEEFKGKFQNYVFGCDVCQDVCPWNRFAKSHSENEFLPKPELRYLLSRNSNEISVESFNEVFESSAVKRTKYSGFIRNLCFLESM